MGLIFDLYTGFDSYCICGVYAEWNKIVSPVKWSVFEFITSTIAHSHYKDKLKYHLSFSLSWSVCLFFEIIDIFMRDCLFIAYQCYIKRMTDGDFSSVQKSRSNNAVVRRHLNVINTRTIRHCLLNIDM